MYLLLLLGGSILATGVLAWWMRRHQRDIDAYEERGYRDPPVFQGPYGGPWG